MTTGRINQVICGFKENIRHGNDDVFYFYDVQKLHMVDFSGIQGTLDIVATCVSQLPIFHTVPPKRRQTPKLLPDRARFLAEPTSWQNSCLTKFLPDKIPS